MKLVETSYLELRDKVQLHAHIDESGNDQWLIVTHGVGEHLERHNYMLSLFKSRFNILQYDLRGHGRSFGRRGYVEKFSDYMEDLAEIIDFLKRKYRMKKYSLFGHSMGALITAGYLQSYARKDFYPERVFLSSPPVGIAGHLGKVVNSLPKHLFSTLGKYAPTIRLSKMVDPGGLSHNPKVVEEYLADPLNCTELHSKLLFEMLAMTREVFTRPLRSLCPIAASVGTKDGIVNYELVVEYFQKVETKALFREFKGAYHEVHNETAKYRDPYYEFLKSFLCGDL